MAFNLRRVRQVLKWLAIGIPALLLFVYVVMLAINWNDESPSPAALEMAELVESRPVVPDSENGFVYLMGACVSRNEDPLAAGSAYIAKANDTIAQPGVWPDDYLDGYACATKDTQTAVSKDVRSVCNDADSACVQKLEENEQALIVWLDKNDWLLERYKKLISYRKWRMTLTFDLRMPFPRYQAARIGQHMLLVKAWVLAGQGEAVAVKQLLESDIRFWRTVLASSDIILSRAIATALLRKHFAFGNLILRRLGDNAAKTVPDSWSEAFSGDELSTQRVSAGEWAFAASLMRDQERYLDSDGPSLEFAVERTAFDRMSDRILLQFSKPQATINEAADLIQRMVNMLDVPMDQFPQALKSVEAMVESQDAFHWYNPYGHFMVLIIPQNHAEFAARVYDLEAIRRAALLTTQLRSQEVTVTHVEEQLGQSTLRNPYDSKPFIWESGKQGITVGNLCGSNADMAVYLY